MGKRATRGKRGRSAVAKQKHWDKLTSKHVEKFIDDIIQNGANSGPSAGNPFEEARQKTLLHDNGWDPGQSPLAQSPTPFEDDSDDSPAPTVIADTDIGNPSELAIGLDSLPPFAAFGTVGSKQEDVAVAFGSSLAAPEV